MRWTHPALPERSVRLAYCMNLHAAEDLPGVLEGIRTTAAPLARRLGGGRPFGVGAYLPAAVARAVEDGEGGGPAGFASFLADHGLEAFTFNAFPYGGFHREGLKADVFRPTWREPERLEFTLAVARIAAATAATAVTGAAGPGGHLSISTHTGLFGAWIESDRDLDECAANFARCAAELAALERAGGPRVVLSLEPEPRASAGSTAELVPFLARVRAAGPALLATERGLPVPESERLLQHHLGTCLDTCHAAVEFEPAAEALANATAAGTPLGKLQLSLIHI